MIDASPNVLAGGDCPTALAARGSLFAARYDVGMLHYLRIAVTALSLTACMLLVALWVRSYWRIEIVYGPLTPTRYFDVTSIDGNIELIVADRISTLADYRDGWGIHSLDGDNSIHFHPIPAWSFSFDEYYADAGFPHWFVVLLSGTLAVVPWIPWSRKFSLRTLLIATTLVALVLGIMVASS